MGNEDKLLWGIHAGRLGEADNLFLKKTVIAIGWHELGNISSSGHYREALKKELTETYPKAKAEGIPVDAQQLYRFITERLPVGLFCCGFPINRARRLHLALQDQRR